MPELPECERARRTLERVLVGRRLERVRCAADAIVLEDGAAAIRRALLGRRVEAAHRRGKQLWLALDRRPWPLFHLGMTGGFRVADQRPLKLASSRRAGEEPWPPRFAKVTMETDDGAAIIFTNARRLGRVRLREDPERESPIADLGFDPLLDPPGAREFAAALHRRRGPLKAILLDQSFAAGVGNWIADEALYQARLDPRRRGADLDDAEARRLRTALLRIVRRAVAVDAEKSRFPRSWLFHHRWGKVAGAVDARGRAIAFAAIGGRTTAWVPGHQR